jgi:integrase
VNLAIEFVRLVLRRAAYYWREDGLSWIENCPILQFEKGRKKQPHTLTVEEEYRLLDALPGLYRKAALFDLHTGLRDTALVELRWEWEVLDPSLGETVFFGYQER